MISIADCKDRTIYRLGSRNLRAGVYRSGTKGFVGVREKFDNRYLFEEYHWENGPPYGTATPYEEMGVLPDEIGLQIYERTVDSLTMRAVEFDRTPTEEEMYPGGPKRALGWYYLDTKEFNRHIIPVVQRNKALYDYMESVERGLNK